MASIQFCMVPAPGDCTSTKWPKVMGVQTGGWAKKIPTGNEPPWRWWKGWWCSPNHMFRCLKCGQNCSRECLCWLSRDVQLRLRSPPCRCRHFSMSPMPRKRDMCSDTGGVTIQKKKKKERKHKEQVWKRMRKAHDTRCQVHCIRDDDFFKKQNKANTEIPPWVCGWQGLPPPSGGNEVLGLRSIRMGVSVELCVGSSQSPPI